MKIIYVNYGVKNYMKENHRSYIYASFSVAKRNPEKNLGLYGIRTPDLYDTAAAL